MEILVHSSAHSHKKPVKSTEKRSLVTVKPTTKMEGSTITRQRNEKKNWI